MNIVNSPIIDWARFAQARAQVGSGFLRVLGYLRDDGAKSLGAIEDALRAHNPMAIIGPADLLKTDAMQIGALTLAELAEDVEFAARDCVEWHQSPDGMVEQVLSLRAAFDETVALMDREVNPLAIRRTA